MICEDILHEIMITAGKIKALQQQLRACMCNAYGVHFKHLLYQWQKLCQQ